MFSELQVGDEFLDVRGKEEVADIPLHVTKPGMAI